MEFILRTCTHTRISFIQHVGASRSLSYQHYTIIYLDQRGWYQINTHHMLVIIQPSKFQISSLLFFGHSRPNTTKGYNNQNFEISLRNYNSITPSGGRGSVFVLVRFGTLGSRWSLGKTLEEVARKFYKVRGLQFVGWSHKYFDVVGMMGHKNWYFQTVL